MQELPSGTLTFLFTDIEDSTPRWEVAPQQMRGLLVRHDEIVRSVIAEHDGVVFKHTGDGVGAVFTSSGSAVEAAIALQIRLRADDWGGLDRLRVRMGLHIGDAAPRSGDYFGAAVNRASRVAEVANGDQIAVSNLLAGLLERFDLRSVGEHQLRGIGTETIHLVSAPGLLADDRPLRARVQHQTRALPPQVNELIGRGVEVRELLALLQSHETVTVVGPGGVGKSRLVIDVARAAVGFFPDGIAFCDLAPLGDGESVADALAEALGAREQPGLNLTESIADYLEGRRMLVILDSCEHLTDAVRSLGQQVLPLGGSAILATSREPIGLQAEQLYGLNPLDPDSDGVTLFMERAQAKDHSFQPTPSESADVREICRRLDGIPLAIELAAAWVRVLTTSDLVADLENQFRVLRGARSGSRHETLWGTVSWSYDQLDEQQARLFDRLSVFAGGFSLQAAASVCAGDELIDPEDVLEILQALVDKSMVVSRRGAGEIRFDLLGTLRQFGQDQLAADGSGQVWRERHADYFCLLAEAETGWLLSDKEAQIWDVFDREWANLRAAFETLLAAGQADKAARLVLELGWFATFSMRFEAFAWVEDLFARTDVDALDDAPSLYGLRALGAYFRVDPKSAVYATRALDLDPVGGRGFARAALAAVSLNNEHTSEASEKLTADWLDQVDDNSAAESRLWAEGMRTFHLCTHAPSPEAAIHAATLRRIAAESGSATARALSCWAGGMVATFDGVELGLDQWRSGLDIARSLGPSHLLVDLLIGLELHFTAASGELDDVLERCLRSLRRAHELHYLAGTSHLFGVTAIVLARVDRAEIGARLLGAMVANGHVPRSNALRAVERVLGDATTETMADGSELSINEAAELAMDALVAALDERAEGRSER